MKQMHVTNDVSVRDENRNILLVDFYFEWNRETQSPVKFLSRSFLNQIICFHCTNSYYILYL